MSAGSLLLAFLLLATPVWSRDAASSSALCKANANLDACYDAMRWNPSDPALLVATGDALMRARRPADAIRNYRRAATLAPNARGIAAKISAAEAKLAANNVPSARRYSNGAPETQSH